MSVEKILFVLQHYVGTNASYASAIALTLTQAARSVQVPVSIVIALNRLGNQVDI